MFRIKYQEVYSVKHEKCQPFKPCKEKKKIKGFILSIKKSIV